MTTITTLVHSDKSPNHMRSVVVLSLLDILAGRKEPRGLSGTVLVDGKQQPKNFKCVSGYVVQVN